LWGSAAVGRRIAPHLLTPPSGHVCLPNFTHTFHTVLETSGNHCSKIAIPTPAAAGGGVVGGARAAAAAILCLCRGAHSSVHAPPRACLVSYHSLRNAWAGAGCCSALGGFPPAGGSSHECSPRRSQTPTLAPRRRSDARAGYKRRIQHASGVRAQQARRGTAQARVTCLGPSPDQHQQLM
jgi:hypothetical protein